MSIRRHMTATCLAAVCIIALTAIIQPRSATALSFPAEVIVLTNAHRRAIMGEECPNLLYNPALTVAAERHAADMARRNYLSHTSRSGATPWRRISWTGYRAVRAAENIAAGYGSPEDVVRGWLESPSHRRNILDCNLREVGVGFAQNPHTRFVNFWVQDFGTRR
jgi:uncharacterized protein YkwD